MNKAEKIQFKNQLKQFCRQHIEKRMAAANDAIAGAQEAANNEEKSSAGDKYETGRAMGHLQKDMHTRQLSQLVKEMSDLLSVNTSLIYDRAAAGAFIETAQLCFFIAAGLGKQNIDEKLVIFLSPNAPLAGLLLNKKPGDGFVFNGKEIVIGDVF